MSISSNVHNNSAVGVIVCFSTISVISPVNYWNYYCYYQLWLFPLLLLCRCFSERLRIIVTIQNVNPYPVTLWFLPSTGVAGTNL